MARPAYGGGHRPAVTVPHPDDPGLLLGDIAALRDLPAGRDCGRLLCPVGEHDEETTLAWTPHWLEVRLVDDDDPAENQNLDFVLHDTVTALEQLRAAWARRPPVQTPAIGALYAMRRTGATPGDAIAAMERALPEADPADAFQRPCRGPGPGPRGVRRLRRRPVRDPATGRRRLPRLRAAPRRPQDRRVRTAARLPE